MPGPPVSIGLVVVRARQEVAAAVADELALALFHARSAIRADPHQLAWIALGWNLDRCGFAAQFEGVNFVLGSYEHRWNNTRPPSPSLLPRGVALRWGGA